MRAALNLILAASFALGPFARAQSAAPTAQPVVVGKEIVAAPEAAKIQRAIRSAIVFRPMEVSVGIGQGLLFIMTAVGIEMVVHDIAKQGLTWETAGPTRLADVANKVAVEIVNNGQVLTALMGAGALTALAKEPTEALVRILVDTEARATLATALSRSILASVGLIGWEFGAQLWTQASSMIKDPEDFKRLQQLFGVTTGSLRALVSFDPTKSDVNDLRIAYTMLTNMVTILFLDGDLLSKWFNDTWRLRVLTGDGALLLALTAAGVAAGVTVLPAGGMIAGIVVGYVVWKVVPQSYKDSGTFLLKSIRASLAAGQLYANEKEISSRVARAAKPGLLSTTDRAKLLSDEISRRMNLRSTFVLAQIDRMHLAIKILRNESATQADRSKARGQVRGAFDEVNRLYLDEMALFRRLALLTTAPEIRSLLSEAQTQSTELYYFWSVLNSEVGEKIGSVDSPLKLVDENTQKIFDYIDGLHIEGFKEASVL